MEDGIGTELLIHSMSEFHDLILQVLELAGARQVVEIGSEFGGMSTILADWVRANGGQLRCVDPAPREEFLQWLAKQAHVQHVAESSLDALKHLPCADAWLIDGDHNWYTVINELRKIFALSTASGNAPLIFLHDVAWPWARRDLYYAPERIPANFRMLHSYDGGVVLDAPALVAKGGFRGNGLFACAFQDGGPRNGVMTAIEDALAEERARGRRLAWCMVPAVFGLGIIFDADAPWSVAVAQLLEPWHENTLLQTLEKNRLKNYLHVLDLQEQLADLRTRVSDG